MGVRGGDVPFDRPVEGLAVDKLHDQVERADSTTTALSRTTLG